MASDDVLALQVPPATRPRRRKLLREDATVVIDNGSYELRAGFSEEESPSLRFPNQLIRPRARSSTDFETVVGDCQFNVKGYDFGRAATRSAFDGNVVVNFDVQETVLDYVFDRLGFEESLESASVVMTECLFNPVYSRSTMTELLFEGYGLSKVTFLPDCMAAALSNGLENGIVVGSGHSATHVVPVVDGKAVLESVQRSKIGGMASTSHLQQLLTVHNPQSAALLTRQTVELIKEQCSFCSSNYVEDLRILSNGAGFGLKVQLPKASGGSVSANESLFDQVVDREAKEESRKLRLKAMTERKREKSIQNRERLVRYYQYVQEQIAMATDPEAVNDLLDQAEVSSLDDLASALDQAAASLARLKEPPQQMPTSDKRDEESLEVVQARYQELAERVELRKRNRDCLETERGISSKRVSVQQRRRMKLVAEAAANEDREDFGADDRDWDVYKEMDLHLVRQEEEELEKTRKKLGKLIHPGEDSLSPSGPEIKEDEVYVSVERIRIPELLFQPSLMGIDQAGVAEIVGRVIKSLPTEIAESVDRTLLLCGGNAAYKGLSSRLDTEMRCLRPLGRPMRLIGSTDWMLDAWNGAALFARSANCAITRSEYEERGLHSVMDRQLPMIHY